MILGFAVMSILALIACALLYASVNKAKKLSKELFDERAISSALRNEKHHEWERANIAEEKITALKQDIADIHASFKKNFIDDEFGSNASWSGSGIATSKTYFLTFCIDPNGKKIMNDLERRFKQNPFTSDERETCRRFGRSEVYDFILNKVNDSQRKDYSEQLEIAFRTGLLEQNDE